MISKPLAALTLLAALAAAGRTDGTDETVVTAGRSTDAGTRLLLAGDVMLGRGIDQIHARSVDPVLYEGYMRSARGYVEIAEQESGPIPRAPGPAYVWGEAIAAWRNFAPQARIVNLETAVTTHPEPAPGKGIHYRMHPDNVRILTAAGIGCAVLANNHVLDWGRAGLRETLGALAGAGIAVAGAGADLAAAAAPARLLVSGGRVLVFAVAHRSSGVPESWAATAERAGVHLLPELTPAAARAVAAHIRAAREPGDVAVVSLHWGGNWGYDVPDEQRAFAHALVDTGAADVVHGHSSHHPKGMEVHGGRLVLYGAGDLINDYEGIGGHEKYRPRLSLLYLPRLDTRGALIDMMLLPFHIERFRLSRASPEDTAWLRDRLTRESTGMAFEIARDGILARPAAPP